MLDHHLGLLCDVVRMQAHEPRQRTGSLLLIHLEIVLDGFDQAVVCFVCRVIPEHVEDKLFLYRLPHAVEMEWFGLSVRTMLAKDLQRPVFGRCCEGKEADVWLATTFCHGAENPLLVVGEVMFGCILTDCIPYLKSCQSAFQVCCTFAAL
uniref:Uncharacterized protein n=1 Tax=Candidatus Methanogaster sp. ANME-2c ERB4 TaxID=2759911 RepID=A0A7G9Y9J2_9EURY|nr:hypothetical protein HMEJMANM_00014 [Methanosarcinales archaeon ANME-2c ERB4]QNO43630.1 hypothetical protein LAPIAFBC_00037 [Methanosarcinales archaeon ANME-2c ERB4]QNO44676.1 hypothetical protein FAIAHACK_00013 [Methanosarcinales archaeon ANME-2c ERB4]